jgi:hypothetical protein
MWSSEDHLKISTGHQLNGYGKWPKKKKKKLKTNMCGSGRKMGLEAHKAQSSSKRGYDL